MTDTADAYGTCECGYDAESYHDALGHVGDAHADAHRSTLSFFVDVGAV